MAKDAPVEKVKVIVKGREISLDPDNMKYDENNLPQYMSKEYGWIDYLGKQLEFAQRELLLAEIDAEASFSAKFMESKDAGNSDNYAKAYANSHVDVVASKRYVVDRKETVGHLKAHLSAWSKNHENAQNRGHTIRTEMKVLNRDIYDAENGATTSAEDFLNSLPGR